MVLAKGTYSPIELIIALIAVLPFSNLSILYPGGITHDPKLPICPYVEMLRLHFLKYLFLDNQ